MFDDISQEDIDDLREYVSPEQPFGPENAKVVKEPRCSYLLFNKYNIFSKEYRQNPRVIIGRRGSGKTTITSITSYIDQHTYIITVKPEEALTVVQAIAYPEGAKSLQYVESTANIWAVFFNTLLMAEACRSAPTSSLLRSRKYLAVTEVPVTGAISGVMGALRRKAESLGQGVASFVVSAFLDALNEDMESSYTEAKRELDDFLEKEGKDAVIIIDSIEDYHLEVPEKADVMGGLLKCVGEFGGRRRSVRLCLPGESYFEVRKCSKNPLKDFNKNLLLQWLPSEIFGIIAWRFQLYNRMYDLERFKALQHINLTDRKGALQIIDELLPKRLTNGIGIDEPTVTYLMRHTQLLPRQVILILNRIFVNTRSDSTRIERVTGQKVVDAVSQVESTLCEEVFTAYYHKYPLAYEVCDKCIPELPRQFDDGTLHKVYNRHGKRFFEEQNPDSEYSDFKKMLIEMGVIGRVRKKTEIYAEAEFEYAKPGRLSVSVDDELCLHPLFSGEFSSGKNSNNGLVVYPQKEWLENDEGRVARLDLGDR